MSHSEPLGSLERKVMLVLWSHPGSTVREVRDRISGRPGPAYTTVMTVCNRLAAKKLVKRSPDGLGFRYTSTADRAGTAARAAAESVDALVRTFGPTAVAGFVEALDKVDPKLLAELRRKSS